MADTKVTADQVLDALRATGGNQSAAARALGVTVPTVRRHRRALEARGEAVPAPRWNPSRGERKPEQFADPRLPDDDRPLSGGRVETRAVLRRALPWPGKVATYILTGAVNNTDIHPQFWENLNALGRYYERDGPVEILVRRIAYNLNAYRRLGADSELGGAVTGDEVYYDPAVRPHVCDERVELAPGLHWAGDAPITATAASPLSGYESFTGEASAVFAATKVEMRSVATMRGRDAKLLFTTGAVTQRNYTETKTGQKADWHHSYGAMLVEVDSEGRWWPRHLIADESGVIHDHGLTVDAGRVRRRRNLAALTPGDVHVAELDPRVREAIYGPGGMVDQLRPRELHHHDLHDHKSRSHHDARDPVRRYELHRTASDDVRAEVEADAAFLRYAARSGMRQVVVGSNHDDHLHRWVKEADWRTDPKNARFLLQAADRVLASIDESEDFHLLEWACRRAGAPEDVVFLRPDQSWVVEGVECGLHGDKGPNGARGSGAVDQPDRRQDQYRTQPFRRHRGGVLAGGRDGRRPGHGESALRLRPVELVADPAGHL